MNWIPFFSQTGSEILHIIKALNVEPLFIVTNKKERDYCEELKQYNIMHFSSFKELEKIKYILDNSIVTLHGFLRIIPPQLITSNMFNGHPGLITKYPELKGFNPQEKAYNLHLKTSGSVIHEVTDVVDSGRILAYKEIDIQNLSLDEIYSKLHDNSINLWIDFLKDRI